ncbi:MAG: hypothetical protein A2687_00145 [Candidatus Levybacteria bacterium RIFCSPHIGHO2_01_FULL_38_26]|nr:MAG: hypothetical protein A2687_00145 [Candidatus Levybacteria bacterium RIFCSPHIGHO2_01_FULL_38_26]
MKLPFSLKFDKKKPELFLVLVLRDEKVNAVVFEEQIGKANILGEQEEYFQDSIDRITQEELLDSLDKAISKAQSYLPDNREPQKTIFGVKEDWIENDKIKKDQLLKLKKACDELELVPIGFLIISQAISYLLQKEEGVPLSAILVDVGKRSITVSLIKAGKIAETRSKDIDEEIPLAVDNLLKQLSTQDALPSRIIIFDGEKNLNYEFISHQWSKTLSFLHLPQITTLKSDFPARAVLFGVATQMGFEVLGEALKIKPDLEKQDKQDPKDTPPHEYENLTPESFGFVKDKDIGQIQEQPKASALTEEILSPQQDEPEPTQTKLDPKTNMPFNLIKTIPKFVKPAIANAKGLLTKIPPQSLPSFSFPTNAKKAILVPVIVVILIVGAGAYYFFGTKATVFLDIKPKIVKQDSNVVFSTASNADNDDSIVNGKSISVSLDGEVSTPTSGKKDIGTKAKGTVTIFNNTSSSKTFPKGSIITSSNDLSFTLEDNATVASASGDVFSGTTPGKINANVLAEKIGTEFNLPSNAKFSIGNDPLIAAKNDEAFSGGTKKEVAVVSQDDIDKLLEELPKKLRQKAEEDLKKQISKEETLLPVILAESISAKNFDKDISEETDRLSLKGTVEYKALSYAKKDLLAQSASYIKKNVSDDQILDEDNIKVGVKNIEKKDQDEIQALLNLEAILKPKIDQQKLIEAITGISYKDAEAVLMKLPQATKVRISSSLEIPLLPKLLPKISENIKIIVTAQ